MRRDLLSHIAVVEAIAPEVLAADNTPAAIDLQNYMSGFISLHIGAGGITFSATNKIEFVLTHSDDDSTYTAVEQSDVQGVTVATGGIVKSLVAAHAAATITRIGYVGSKRYLKLLADFSGTHGTGTPIAATMVSGRPVSGPVS